MVVPSPNVRLIAMVMTSVVVGSGLRCVARPAVFSPVGCGVAWCGVAWRGVAWRGVAQKYGVKQRELKSIV